MRSVPNSCFDVALRLQIRGSNISSKRYYLPRTCSLVLHQLMQTYCILCHTYDIVSRRPHRRPQRMNTFAQFSRSPEIVPSSTNCFRRFSSEISVNLPMCLSEPSVRIQNLLRDSKAKSVFNTPLTSPSPSRRG